MSSMLDQAIVEDLSVSEFIKKLVFNENFVDSLEEIGVTEDRAKQIFDIVIDAGIIKLDDKVKRIAIDAIFQLGYNEQYQWKNNIEKILAGYLLAKISFMEMWLMPTKIPKYDKEELIDLDIRKTKGRGNSSYLNLTELAKPNMFYSCTKVGTTIILKEAKISEKLTD